MLPRGTTILGAYIPLCGTSPTCYRIQALLTSLGTPLTTCVQTHAAGSPTGPLSSVPNSDLAFYIEGNLNTRVSTTITAGVQPCTDVPYSWRGTLRPCPLVINAFEEFYRQMLKQPPTSSVHNKRPWDTLSMTNTLWAVISNTGILSHVLNLEFFDGPFRIELFVHTTFVAKYAKLRSHEIVFKCCGNQMIFFTEYYANTKITTVHVRDKHFGQ